LRTARYVVAPSRDVRTYDQRDVAARPHEHATRVTAPYTGVLQTGACTSRRRRQPPTKGERVMPGPGESDSLQFEKVSLSDARKALDESGPAAYKVARKTENWEDKRTDTPDETLDDAASAWMNELPASVRPRQLAIRYARLVNRIARLWSDPVKCGRLLDDLMTDRRGGRKGFPLAIASELATLRDHYFRQHHDGQSPWEYVETGR